MPARASAVGAGPRSASTRVNAQAVQVGDLRQVEAGRRAEQLLVAVAMSRDRQEVEDPAAAVVRARRSWPRRRAGSRPAARSCRGRGRRRRSARRSVPSAQPRRPSPDETRPSMPFAPRLARKRSGRRGRGQERLEVAHRHARRDVHRRCRRQQRRRGRDARAARTARRRARSGTRRPRLGGRGGRQPATLQPGPVARGSSCSANDREQRPGVDPRDQVGRSRSARSSRRRGRSRPGGSVGSRQPRAHRLRGDHVAHPDHEVGRETLRQRRGRSGRRRRSRCSRSCTPQRSCDVGSARTG